MSIQNPGKWDSERRIIVFAQVLVILIGFACVLYPAYNCDFITFYFRYFSGETAGSFRDWMLYRTGEGRPLAMLLYVVSAAANAFHIPYEGYYRLIQLIGLVFLCLAEYLVFSLFSREQKGKKQTLIALAVLVGFLNPFLTEGILFIDPNHGQAMLFMSLALSCLFSGEGVKRTILSGLFLFLSISTYQSYYAGFLLYGICYAYVFHKGKRGYLKVLIVTGAASFLNLFLTKTAALLLGIVNRHEVALMDSGAGNLIGRFLRPILSYGKAVIFSYYTIPAGIFAAMALIGIIGVFRKEKTEPDRKHGWLCLLLIWAAPIAYAYVQASYYTAPRILAPVFMSLSATWLILFSGDDQKEKPVFRFAEILLILFLGICVIGVNMTIFRAVKTNGIEIAGVHAVHDRITAYEEDSGKQVDTIAVYKMYGALQEFKKANGLIPLGGVQTELLGPTWSDVGTVNYFNKTQYKRQNMDEETFRTLFVGLTPPDLRSINVEKQLKIVDHTAYWVTYAFE